MGLAKTIKPKARGAVKPALPARKAGSIMTGAPMPDGIRNAIAKAKSVTDKPSLIKVCFVQRSTANLLHRAKGTQTVQAACSV